MIDPTLQVDPKNTFLIRIARLTELMAEQNMPDEDRSRVLFERGKLYWKLGDRPSAVKDYLASVELNPASPAAMALDNARDIENFFNTDLYNP